MSRNTVRRPLWHTAGTLLLFVSCLASVLWALDGHWMALTGSHMYEPFIWLSKEMVFWAQRPEGLIMFALLGGTVFVEWFLSSPSQRIASMRQALRHRAEAIAKDPGEYLKRSSLYRN